MSKIPYQFETPVPRYFRENGWFDNEHMFKYVTWAFSKCQCISRKIVIEGKEIVLQPFEFVSGRLTSSNECFLTENVFRNQQKTMLSAGLLKKSTNSLTNHYSCYIWSTDRFSEIHNQQNNQPLTNHQPTVNHKEERPIAFTQVKESAISANARENAKVLAFCAPPVSQEERIRTLALIGESKGYSIPEEEFSKWVKKHSDEEIIFNLDKVSKSKKLIDNPASFIQTGLRDGYFAEFKRIPENKRFAEEFKERNRWASLTITKKYCRDENNGKDLYFSNENFKEFLMQIFKSQQENLA